MKYPLREALRRNGKTHRPPGEVELDEKNDADEIEHLTRKGVIGTPGSAGDVSAAAEADAKAQAEADAKAQTEEEAKAQAEAEAKAQAEAGTKAQQAKPAAKTTKAKG